MGGKKRNKPNNAKQVFFRLFKYMASYRVRLFIVFICVIISSISGVRATYYLKPAINDYIVPLIGQKNPDMSGFLRILSIMAVLYLCSVTTLFIQNGIMAGISNNIMCQVRSEMFEAMEKLPVSYFSTNNNGRIMSYYSNDVDALSNMLRQSFPRIIEGVVTCLSILLTIFFVNIPLAIVVVLCVSLLALTLKFLVGNKAVYFIGQQRSLGELNAYGEEMINGKTEIKAFTREEKVKKKFGHINKQLFQTASKSDFFADSMFSLTKGLTNIGYTIVAACGCALSLYGAADVGTVGAFLVYYRNLISPVTRISKQVNNLFSALAGAERVFDFLNQEPEIDEGKVSLVNCTMDGEHVQECETYTGKYAWKLEDGTCIPCEGKISFEHVVFGYTENQTVLRDFNLHAQPGQKIAIVGTTGAGKTTIINLLNRLYEIRSGEIYFDDINIRDIKKSDLRRAAGMVPQETHLFTDTVAENIRYGRLDASDEDVRKAAQLANADYFIGNLPDGYDTVLTHAGAALSQGERQLLAIARASVGQFPVLILDEATSSIDTRTEMLIDCGLDTLMKGRTVFVIAHRLSTIKNADKIVVLDQGRVVETGTHEELIDKRGIYYNLYAGVLEQA